MDVLEAIEARYSARSYQDRRVEQEKLDRIMQAARLAPSASNRQEWRFIIVQDEQKRQQLAAAASGQTFIGHAPTVIVACAVTDMHEMPCGQLSYPIDIAIAVEHIALQATNEGLGTCWIGAFEEDRVADLVDLPSGDEYRVVALMPLGYPDDAPGAKSRLSMNEIVMYDKWDE